MAVVPQQNYMNFSGEAEGELAGGETSTASTMCGSPNATRMRATMECDITAGLYGHIFLLQFDD